MFVIIREHLLRNNTLSHKLLLQPNPIPNPIKNRPMPKQTIIPIRNPMPLIRKMQKPTRHAQALQHIKRLQRLRNNNPIIQIIPDHKLRRAEILRMHQRVPEFVVVAVVPDGAVVVALDEPELVGGVGTDLRYLAVVAYECFEFAAERVALDPVGHEAAEGGAGGDGARGVDVRDVGADVREDFDEVGVGGAAPVVLDLKVC